MRDAKDTATGTVPDDMKVLIDGMTYEQLLRSRRFAVIGDPLFMGATGEYFMSAMAKKRAALGQGEAVAASKAIGWEA